MTRWDLRETPVGVGYETCFDGVARQGEAVDFGYVATLEAGTLHVPDCVSVHLARTAGDTASEVTATATVTPDTNGYSVALVLPTSVTDTLSGDYVYEVKERRDTNETLPYGGAFTFAPRVEG